MKYELVFLDDQEFEALPYLDTHTSLGLADTKAGKAYVRSTGVNAVDAFTALHELEHLEGETLGEYDRHGNGVYYKDFGSALGGAANSIGSAMGGAAKSIGGAASSVGSGISNMAGSLGQAMGFGGGFQGGANPSGGMAAAAASNPALRAPMGAGFGGLSQMGQTLGQIKPPSMLSTQGMGQGSPLNQIFGSQGLSVGQMGGGGMGASSPKISTPSVSSQAQGQGQTQQQPGMMQQMGSQLMQGLGQAGISKLMSSFQGSAQGGGPMSRLGDMSNLPSVQAYKNYDLRGNLMAVDPEMLAAMNRDFDQMDSEEEKAFRGQWKNIRPGADLESDSVFARDLQKLKSEQVTRRADAMAGYRLQNLQVNYGINKDEAQRLQDLAQLDVDTISFNTGLDAMEAMQLKQIAGGGEMESSSGSLMSQFAQPLVDKATSFIGGL